MIAPLHLLLATPEPADDLLAVLRHAGYDPRPQFITQPEALGERLQRGSWDALIIQHGLPALSSWDALAWVERQAVQVPVLVLTEEHDEGTTVALLEAGARDVIRTSDLDRLGVAVAKARRWKSEATPSVPSEPSPDAAFRDLAEHISIGLYRTSEDGRILYANPAFARLLGAEAAEDLLGKEVSGMVTYPREAFTEALRGEDRVQNYEAWWERDGEALCTRENARAVRDAEGRLLYYEGTIEEVTEEQTALLALRDSEASLRTIAEATGLVFYRRRSESEGYDQLSASIEALTGYAPAAFAEQGGLDALSEYCEVAAGKDDEPRSVVHRLRTADGERRWVEDTPRPWLNEAGQVLGQAGVLRDVTEQREREDRERAHNERRLDLQKVLTKLSGLEAPPDEVLARTTAAAARAMQTSRVSLWLLDDEAVELQCRDLYVRADSVHRTDSSFRAESMAETLDLLGQKRVIATTDVLDKPAAERYGLDVYHARNGVRAVLSASVRRQEQVAGFVALEHDEARVWTEDEQDFAIAVADLIALVLERSERGEAEETHHHSENRYQAISELAADFAYAMKVDPDQKSSVVWATAAFERISGYALGELADYESMIGIVHEDDRAAVEEALGGLSRGRTVTLECRIQTKAGEERWVAHRCRLARDGGEMYVYASGRDITQRKQFESDLVEARTEAESLARQKSAFLASMSHEIRTPLTALLGFAGVLAEEVDESHREIARLVQTSGIRLLETLNSVLDLAQLESLDLSTEPLHVVEEAKQVIRLLAPLAEQKGLDLYLEDGGADVIAPLDPVCLRRILTNLIGNAIKFTEHGEVVVGASVGDHAVRIWVRDTGIGIDEAFLPHLFDKFKQETAGQPDGSGLGLAITQHLADLMDGTVAVESQKGEGSTFTLTFPLVFDEEHVQRAVGMALAKGQPGTARLVDESDDQRPRVLVVEDNHDVRRLIERILGEQYRVDVAAQAYAALDMMRDATYDALVLDINLGGDSNGEEVLQVARTLPGHETVVALALTAYALPGDRERFLDNGFDAYLAKPFTKDELMNTLQSMGMIVTKV